MEFKGIKIGMKLKMKERRDCRDIEPRLMARMPYGKIVTVSGIYQGVFMLEGDSEYYKYAAEWFDPISEESTKLIKRTKVTVFK